MGRTAAKSILRGWTWVIAISITVWWADPAKAILLDFDIDASGNPIVAGQIIDDEYASFGVTIETINVGGGPDLGVAFDSANPTGGDNDLQTPGSTTGNAKAGSFGNVLIIQENGGASDGMINVDPDDEGSRPAGFHTFIFDTAITSIGFVLIDIEGLEEINGTSPTSGFFQAFNNGTLIGTVSFEDFITAGPFFDSSVVFGNNSVNRIDPILASDFGAAGFNKVVFNFGGSGGLDEVDTSPVPEPGTLLLLGSSMVGMGAIVRKRTRQRSK